MINSIRSEWIKFRSVRSTLILLMIGGLITVAIGALSIGEISDNHQSFNLTDISGGAQISVILFGALGVQIIGQEYRFNTIRPTFSATPNRWRVLVAKMVVISMAVAVVAALMLGVCVLMGKLFLDGFALDDTDVRIIWGTVLFAVLWSLAGVGVGAILRQPIAGIIILLVEGGVVEPIVGGLFSGTVKWLPFLNGSQMMFRNEGDPDPNFALRSPLDGGVYFAMVIAVVLALGLVLAQRRDA